MVIAVHQQIFNNKIQVVDDPQIIRGHGSRLYDGEGIIPVKRNLIKNGILQTWLLNSSSARQLNRETTGHASRNISSPPGVSSTNAYIEKAKPFLDVTVVWAGS